MKTQQTEKLTEQELRGTNGGNVTTNMNGGAPQNWMFGNIFNAGQPAGTDMGDDQMDANGNTAVDANPVSM